MTSYNSNNSRSSDSLARLLYSQRLLAHRNVLLVGGDYGLAEFVADSGARRVTVVAEQTPKEPWPGAGAGSPVDLQIMPLGALKFRDGEFDAVVIQDFTSLADPTAALEEARRVTGVNGHVVIASSNPSCELRLGSPSEKEPMDYYEMYDLLASIFPSVQMIGQSPFIGYAVADLSCEDPELQVSFDTSLLGGESEDIESFLAVCGLREADLDPYSVIQIPFAEAALGKANEADLDAARIEIKSLNEELANAQERGKSLKAEFDQVKKEVGNRGVRIASLEKELEAELKQSEAARARAVQLAKELDDERRAKQKKQLEEEYSKRTSDMELQTKLRDLAAELRQAQERAKSAETAHDQLVGRMREDAAEIDNLRNKNESLEKENGNLKGSVLKDRDSLEQENVKLENGLREKAAALNDLGETLKKREALIRDLVVELENKERARADLMVENERLQTETAALNGARAGQYRARVEAELALAALEMEARRTDAELIEARMMLDRQGGGRWSPADDAGVTDRELAQAQNRIAKLEGELQAARWRMAELETRNNETAKWKTRAEELEKGVAAVERGARMTEEEAERYKNRAKETEADLENERRRCEELLSEVAEAAKRQTRLENDLADLTERLGAAQRWHEEARQSAAEAERRALEAEERFHASDVELQGTRERISYVSTDAKTIETELRREIAGELEQATRLSTTVKELEERLDKAKADFDQERERNDGLTRTLEMLRAELAEESDRTRKAGADAARLAGEKGDLKLRNSRLEQELGERVSELASNERVIVSLREELKELSEKVQQLRSARTEDQEKADQQSSQGGAVADLEAAKLRAEELERELDESRNRSRSAESELAQMRARLETMGRELAETAEGKGAAEARLEYLQSTLKAAEVENKTLAEKTSLLEERAKSAKAALEAEVRSEHEALLNSVTAQLEEREQRASRLERELKELQNQIKEHGSDVAAWDMELKFRNSRISQLEEENLKLQETVLELKKTN